MKQRLETKTRWGGCRKDCYKGKWCNDTCLLFEDHQKSYRLSEKNDTAKYNKPKADVFFPWINTEKVTEKHVEIAIS